MKPAEYATMRKVEDEYWWYLGLRDLILGWLRAERARLQGRALRLLDAGCGTGGLLARLPDGVRAHGFDLSSDGIGFCAERGLKRVARASICEIPFASESFDCVVSADVLCNLKQGDDLRALAECRRVLAPGGVLILNLPAYERLRSSHDVAVHIQHRYTRAEVVERLQAAGFRLEHVTYRNTILFPAVAAIRWFRRPRSSAEAETASDLRLLNPMLNGILTSLLRLESSAIRAGLRLPFGLSVSCLARR